GVGDGRPEAADLVVRRAVGKRERTDVEAVEQRGRNRPRADELAGEGVRASAGARIANARGTSIRTVRTSPCEAGRAGAGAAHGVDRASIAVATCGAVGGGGIRTSAGCRIARTRRVALVARGADDGIAADACARLAGVRSGAGGAVVARGA